MPKVNVRKQITEAKLALKDVMREHLAGIAANMISQIISKLDSLPESKRLQAINDVNPKGQQAYRQSLLSAFAVVASDALNEVRKEVPKAKSFKLAEDEDSIKLGEFDLLPFGMRNKILKQNQLLVETQIGDLFKAIGFQFTHSVDSTDSLELIRKDLEEAAFDYVAGPATEAGAGSMAAKVINETRNEFFFDPEVLEQLDAFEFMNGDPVSAVCQDLAGTVFAKDDPNRFRYTPPLHWGCKSFIIAILAGNLKNREIVPLKPSTAKIESTIQFSERVCCGGELHFHE